MLSLLSKTIRTTNKLYSVKSCLIILLDGQHLASIPVPVPGTVPGMHTVTGTGINTCEIVHHNRSRIIIIGTGFDEYKSLSIVVRPTMVRACPR